MQDNRIDFVKESKRIIEQAYVSAHILTAEQTRKLIQDKIDRAYKLREALKKSNLFRTNEF